MTHKTHDLAVVVGEYTDRDGNKKKRYQNIGALMQGDNGPYLMLAKWFNPAGVMDARGGESILISCFEPKNKSGNTVVTRPIPDDFDDIGIPF